MMTTLLMAVMAGKQMKKQLFIISILVVIISVFVSCSVNGSNEDISTTADGTTHYYEIVTDDSSTVLNEIETQPNGKVVTEKNGKYVTNEHTTVLSLKSVIDNSSTAKSTTEKSSPNTTTDIKNADNAVEFEPDKPTEETKPSTSTSTEKPTTTTTQKATQPATDKDGWVTKWY